MASASRKEDEKLEAASGSDQPRAARTYSGARGNRPQDVPPAARFRRETPEDAARRPNSTPELDAERERYAKAQKERADKEAKELEAAIRKANGG